MERVLGLLLLAVGSSVFAFAGAAPEISAGSAASGLTLLSGIVMVMRARKK